MKKTGYERFGLMASPFHEVDGESVPDAELFHVNAEADRTLRTMKEEVLDRQRKALILLSGPMGIGKTERLRVAEGEAKRLGATAVYLQMSADEKHLLRGFVRAFMKSTGLGAVTRLVNTPKWYRELQKLEGVSRKPYDPEVAAAKIAVAVKETSPCFLLFNDLHQIGSHPEGVRFLETLQALAARAEPGLFLLAACSADQQQHLLDMVPALASRLTRVLELPGLNDSEAALLLAKRMAGKRLIEELDPLYPFDREAAAELNRLAKGNPRELLKAADRVLDAAVRGRWSRVDSEAVRSALGRTAVSIEEASPVLVPTFPAHRAKLGGGSLMARMKETRQAE